MATAEVGLLFNFRSPYRYRVSRSLFDRLAAFEVALVCARSVGGMGVHYPALS